MRMNGENAEGGYRKRQTLVRGVNKQHVSSRREAGSV